VFVDAKFEAGVGLGVDVIL